MLLFSQSAFSDNSNETTLQSMQKSLNTNIKTFIKEYDPQDTYKLNSFFNDIRITIRDIRDAKRTTDIKRLEDLKYFFLNGLDSISCSREKKCKKLREKIKKGLQEYYDLAKDVYNF